METTFSIDDNCVMNVFAVNVPCIAADISMFFSGRDLSCCWLLSFHLPTFILSHGFPIRYIEQHQSGIHLLWDSIRRLHLKFCAQSLKYML